ncbi:4Fe-4S single cluster domain-containing protein [Candidatus Thiodictyon syntrophicum]|jgi:anaerobic ribonucleoside-triphosphate reductase activating protein
MTPDAHPFEGGESAAIDRLAAEILAVDDIEGLTVSGGEPFAQAAGLAALIRQVRAHRDLGLILYTGYRLEDLQRKASDAPGTADLLGRIDLLIDGPYVAAQNDGVPLRGSANQRVIPLTDRYLAHLHCYDSNRPRAVELHVEIGERMLVGIPSARQLAWWRSSKEGPAQAAAMTACPSAKPPSLVGT